MGYKKWMIPQTDKQLANRLAEECGIDPLVALIACSRGMCDPVEIDEFLSDDLLLASPFELIDMDKAVARIRAAIENFEKIAIYGDYDCDGVTSTALLYSYLSGRAANVIFYIPDRADEGYGMNSDSVEKLKSMEISLIITVDNGISAAEEIDYARSLGIDVVVTDHHLPGGSLPEASAVVDPHRSDCPSEFKNLAGVGVAFKLICALEQASCEEMLPHFADLVALGTIADVMPLVGENRALVKAGLQKIAEEPRIGISALIEASGLQNKKIGSGSVSFMLAPRINAAGRMGRAERAVRLLLEEDYGEALEIAGEISGENSLRQQIEQQIVAEACAQIEAEGYAFDRVIVVAGENWHHGIVGIAASRLAERYGRPCIVLSVQGESAVGSGRSISGFSLFDAIKSAEHLLTRYGGHELAAGLTLQADLIPQFRKAIGEFAACQYPDMPFPQIKLDCKLNPAALSVDLAASLSSLTPYGSGNPTPMFGLFGMKIEKCIPLSGGKHLKLYLSRGSCVIQALMFGTAPEDFLFAEGDMVDAAVILEINLYQNEPCLSVQIRDIRLSGLDEETFFRQIRFYEAFRRGELTAELAPAVTPGRGDMALVYRYAQSCRGHTVDLEQMVNRLCRKSSYGKIRVAVDVLQEMGILTVSETASKTLLSVNELDNKVNLEDSGILQRLKSTGREVEV